MNRTNILPLRMPCFAKEGSAGKGSSSIQAGKNAHRLVGIDRLNRTFPAIDGYKKDRYVGMFYFLWVGQEKIRDIYDMTEFMKTEEGRKDLFNPAGSETSPLNQFYFWGEPQFGYYTMLDEYVIRKHIEMLTLAGVDFLYLDVTNSATYDAVWAKLLPIISEYAASGWNPPRVVFYTHSRSIMVAKKLYAQIYAKNLCPDSWFYLDGKPLIIAYEDPAQDRAALQKELGGYMPPDYENSPVFTEEERNFFTFRTPQWPNEARVPGGFPWMEWRFPNYKQEGVANVSLAQHPALPMSFSYLRGYTNYGRGWDGTANSEARIMEGANFQRQFNKAIEEDPRIITVTGWNEWVALKFVLDGDVAFVDAFLLEYSRDIEPMKGGYEDAYYQQLIQNIRRFKGLPESGGNAEPAAYYPVGSTDYGRNSPDASRQTQYKQAAPLNNIEEVSLSHDAANIYFRVTCKEDIRPAKGSNWFNILIGTGTPAEKGWEGYEFVANRTPGKLEALSANATREPAGDIITEVAGKTAVFTLSRAGLSLPAGGFSLYFKVADGVSNPEDGMEYYNSGSCVPMGRLSYSYRGE